MPKPYDTRVVGIVSQQQFEVDLNRFCKLTPVAYVDGVVADPNSFPNDGEIWWMLTSQAGTLAQPGRLISCFVEDARQYDEYDPTKSLLQAQRDSVRELSRVEDGMEIISVAPDSVGSVQEFASPDYQVSVNHPLTPAVLLKWRGEVLGPFTTSLTATSGNEFMASFAPANMDMTVFSASADDLEDVAADALISKTTEVSLTQHRREESSKTITVVHELLLARGFEKLLTQSPSKIVLEPIDRKLVRFAKQILTRRKRQELRGLLDELELKGTEVDEVDELREAVGRIRTVSDRQEAALDTVTKALLASGLLGEDRLKRAEKEYAEKHLQERTAQLQAQIESSVSSRKDELRRVERALEELRAKLQREEAEGRAHIEAKLEAEAAHAKKELTREREALETDRAELDRKEEILRQNLQEVTAEFRDAGDQVVNRFLSIAPFLGQTVPAAPVVPTKAEAVEDVRGRHEPVELTFPAYLTGNSGQGRAAVTEEEFYDRFQSTVEAHGFIYRDFDLKRFHLSVKCGDLTVLGGPSGTGKSSLPQLYAKALLGDDLDVRRQACLMVNVSPSWMDVRDLLGHMNTLEGRFYPSESGLYERLVHSAVEHMSKGGGSAVYLTCLDEMNLSQVEHYFSEFMMTLERQGDDRAIQCFSEGVAGEDCPYRGWARVALSPSLRFVGTVNFDETTRALSDRLLDRTNLLRLSSKSIPNVASLGDEGAAARGAMVTLAELQDWIHDIALPADLGLLLDSIRPLLVEVGCPMSPRVYRAICRFVGSSSSVMSSETAFDAQLAQRVIPKIRNVVSVAQLDALDGIVRALEDSTVSSFEESRSMLEDVRNFARSHTWDLGD